jgi:hypothetical protein
LAIGAGFGFLPVSFNAAEVELADFGFFCERGCAGDDRRWGCVT